MVRLRRSWPVVLTCIVATLFLAMPRPARGASVTPVVVAGNPTCTDLGYAGRIKVDPPTSGTYGDGFGNDVTVVTSDGVHFDWSSTFGVDVVISKGGQQGANIYTYDPPAESFGDTDLVAPNNPNGDPAALSHMEFCFDYEVTVAKTANTTFTRTHHWSIDKSVAPASWNLFNGDSGTSLYTVTVDHTGSTDSDWAVSGTITIQNNTPSTATITGVSDEMTGGIVAAVDCGVSFPYDLPSGDALECTYGSSLPDGSDRTNTATATTSGAIGGGSGSAAVEFGAPSTEVNASVNVDDTNGSSWLFSDDGSVSYTKTFSCGNDAGNHGNTASIRETGQSDSASVSVACYELAVSKTARTSLDRDWSWTLDKTGDQTDLTLSSGQTFLVNYQVTVRASSEDSGWAVNGGIEVDNPAPIPAVLLGVSDLVSGGYSGTVDCGVTFPYTLAAGLTLSCSYDGSLPDASARINTATATQQNFSFAPDGTATANGTSDSSGSAAVDFAAAAVNETDECISVDDDRFGPLGNLCADAAPKVFAYSMNVGPFDAPDGCGEHDVVNTASFTTNDTGATGEDSHTVHVTVPCDNGCTLTPGYWKTHSQVGPAPYDDTWALLGAAQENTAFFLSGKSYYQVLWTAPNGNAYYILAHAYIAATLNMLNGASTPPEVLSAWNEATTLFQTYTPAQIGALKGNQKPRPRFLELAGLLDMYNNGLIGPGHCSE